ncbi:outer membrane protein [Dyella sp.]|uniref:outer membrane protein n=1 Tax=Dyella sp. TaxID=1869338 RepID=UPI002ED57667
MDFRIVALGLGMLFSVPVVAQEGFYVSGKLLGVQRPMTDMTLTSPRVSHRVTSPQDARRFNGSLAAGMTFAKAYRAELEYTLPSTGQYVARWAPFVNNDNRLKTRAQRLMVNVYRDWAVSPHLSIHGMAGVGGAWIRADGWQTRPDRAFALRTTFRPAYSLGLGAGLQVAPDVVLDAGYRYVRSGQFSTGRNRFANAAMARDEQLQARYGEHNVYVGVRKTF